MNASFINNDGENGKLPLTLKDLEGKGFSKLNDTEMRKYCEEVII